MLLPKHKLDSINHIFSNYTIIQPPDYSKIMKDRNNIAAKIMNRNLSAYLPFTYTRKLNSLQGSGYPKKYSSLSYNQNLISSNNHRSYNLHNLPQKPDDVRVIEIPQGLPQIITSNNYIQSKIPNTINEIPQQNENHPEIESTNIKPPSIGIVETQQPPLPEVPTDMKLNEPPVEIENQAHLIEEENQKIKNEQLIEAENKAANEANVPPPVVETPVEVNEPVAQGKYSFPNNKIVQLPNNFSTDSEEQNKAINTLNEDLSQWDLKVDKPDVKVYAKIIKVMDVHNKEWETAEMYVDSTIDKPAAIVAETLHDLDLPKKMGRDSKKNKIISVQETATEKIVEQYTFMKMPFPFDNRETVTKNFIWKDFCGIQGSTLSYLTSITHPDFPENEKTCRAEFVNRTTYVNPISDNKSRMILVNVMNMKMSMGASMMASKGCEKQEEWVRKFIKLL